LLSVVRDETADPHVRLDAAKAAAPFVHSRMAPSEPKRGDPEYVPLIERLKEYVRRDAIDASAGNVVPLQRRDAIPANGRNSPHSG